MYLKIVQACVGAVFSTITLNFTQRYSAESFGGFLGTFFTCLLVTHFKSAYPTVRWSVNIFFSNWGPIDLLTGQNVS